MLHLSNLASRHSAKGVDRRYHWSAVNDDLVYHDVAYLNWIRHPSRWGRSLIRLCSGGSICPGSRGARRKSVPALHDVLNRPPHRRSVEPQRHRILLQGARDLPIWAGLSRRVRLYALPVGTDLGRSASNTRVQSSTTGISTPYVSLARPKLLPQSTTAAIANPHQVSLPRLVVAHWLSC